MRLGHFSKAQSYDSYTGVTIWEDQHNTILHFITPFIIMFPVEVFLNRRRDECPFYVGLTYIIQYELHENIVNHNLVGTNHHSRNIYIFAGLSRDYPNSRAGLFPRLSELPSRAFPETLRTPELGFSRDSPNSRAGLFPRLSELPNWASPETLLTPEAGFS